MDFNPVEKLTFREVRRTRLTKYAGLDEEVISLGLAESDFEMPKEVKEAMINAILTGRYHYEMDGVPEFIEAAKEKLRRVNRIPVGEDEILPTVGVMNGIWLTYKVLLKPGDHVIVVTPTYPPLINRPKSFQSNVTEVKLKQDGHLDLDGIEKAVTERTRMITICNPNNPTGTVYTREELEQLAEIALRHDLYVFSDELYEDLTYDGRKHVSIASLPDMHERTVTAFGFTKTYGMSGLRIGYIAAERETIKRMREENASIVIQPGTIEQIGAATALKKCGYYTEFLRNYLEKVRNKLIETLNEVQGVIAPLPEGTFFAFPNLSRLFEDDKEAVEYILREAGVRVYEGSGFGEGGRGHVRINFCSPMEIIEEAASRIKNALMKLNEDR
ncbi:MAG: pyridoxal phosphate-dependent aminotransferase [Thermofilaceae archaeon]|nr:pyridoxal phosphate-dependent aminotransferase [Thermofilaceae archaeon]MDW8004698.1 pyridoxal phosphate-dependent aminotransferase [Thermofilaceae archaeon]